eukprot:1125574-Alexandrium_andersonii.AAC.1
MSASLVGSEMCIRDRIRSHCRGPSLPRDGDDDHGGNGEEADEWAEQGYSCLLYTSDAADDM